MTKVVTIGLGYIGFPTSALIASKGIKVHGVDINKNIVDTINRGEIHIVEPELDDAVKKSVKEGTLTASTKAVVADVYIIVVPTPFKGDYKPDTSFIEKATLGIISLLKPGDLYILESTSPVGTTEKMQKMIFAQRPELRNKIFIAYCPERVLPGNIMYELENNERVVGGVDEVSTKKAISFYSGFVKGALHPTDAKTAEMCKLAENASRDVQIAFANELSLICNKASIDVWDLIDLANKHPRVNILQPSCGVGGHCIAVDPYFIKSSFPEESKIISTSRKINKDKPHWCIEQIQLEIDNFISKNNFFPALGICGLSYKPNIDDLRESPAALIASRIIFQNKDLQIFINEPNIKYHPDFNLTSFKALHKKADIIIFLVAHDEYKGYNFDTNKVTINFTSIR